MENKTVVIQNPSKELLEFCRNRSKEKTINSSESISFFNTVDFNMFKDCDKCKEGKLILKDYSEFVCSHCSNIEQPKINLEDKVRIVSKERDEQLQLAKITVETHQLYSKFLEGKLSEKEYGRISMIMKSFTDGKMSVEILLFKNGFSDILDYQKSKDEHNGLKFFGGLKGVFRAILFRLKQYSNE